jgi:hypothetical protein
VLGSTIVPLSSPQEFNASFDYPGAIQRITTPQTADHQNANALNRSNTLPNAAIAELAQLDQWVNWRYLTRNGKRDKPPVNPHTGELGDHTDPATWSTYTHVRESSTRIGFVFHPSDPYSGVDLDGCRNQATGVIEGWAQRWIDALASYTEISPSGTGVKIFVRGTLPEQLVHAMGPHIGIEVYSEKRYFAVTGQHLTGTPETIHDAQATLDLLWAEYHPKPAPVAPRTPYTATQSEAPRGRQSAREVIERLNRSNDLGSYLESQGSTHVNTRGDIHHYSGLNGEKHSHKVTYTVSPARDGNGQIGVSLSPNGQLGKANFPRGFRWFDAICALEYGGRVTDALKALNPIARSNPAPVRDLSAQEQPDYMTPAAIEHRHQEAQRKRDSLRRAAAATRADVRARAAADTTLRPSEQAVLTALLTIAGDRDWCRPSKERIAKVSGLGLGTVKRALFSPAKGGRLEGRYFTSEGDGGGPKTTAIRTFLRGSIAPALIPMVSHESDSILESLVCERGGIHPPASVFTQGEGNETEQEAQNGRLLSSDPRGGCGGTGLDGRGGSGRRSAPGSAGLSPASQCPRGGNTGDATAASPRATGEPAESTAREAALDPDRDLLSRVRDLAREAAEPGWVLRDYAELDEAALLEEASRLEGLLASRPKTEIISVLPPAAAHVDDQRRTTDVAELPAGTAGAWYDRAADWTEGGVLDLSQWHDPAQIRPRAGGDVDQVAPAEQLELEQPAPIPAAPARRRRRSEISATDRYRLDLAGMEETALAGELKKHKNTLKKHAGAPWLTQVREKLALVEAELDSRELAKPDTYQGLEPRAIRRRAAASPPPERPSAPLDQAQLQLPLELSPDNSGSELPIGNSVHIPELPTGNSKSRSVAGFAPGAAPGSPPLTSSSRRRRYAPI